MAVDVRKLSDEELTRASTALETLVPWVFEKAQGRRRAEAARVDLALAPIVQTQATAIRAVLTHAIRTMKQVYLKSHGNVPRTIVAGRQIMSQTFPAVHRRALTAFLQHGYERGTGQVSHRIGKAAKKPTKPTAIASFDVTHPDIAAYIRNRARRYSPMITVNTMNQIRDILEQGAEEGLPLAEVANRIFDQELPDISEARAMRIARTESVSANNAGANAAYKASGVVEMKEWLTAGDDKVRETHGDVDGEVVPIDEPFDLEGGQLMFPGDDSLDADESELINCRCAIAPYIPDVGEATTEGGMEGEEGEESSGEKSGEGHGFARDIERVASRLAAEMQKAERRLLQGVVMFRGLPISIENQPGTSRHWTDPNDGSSGMTMMQYPYGYIRGTEGLDGDQVDVFLGPHEGAPDVYVITQLKAPEFTQVDEQKVMLGFASAEDARAAYLEHYDNRKFFGRLDEMPFDEFAEKVRSSTGRVIKAFDESQHPRGEHGKFTDAGGGVKTKPAPGGKSGKDVSPEELMAIMGIPKGQGGGEQGAVIPESKPGKPVYQKTEADLRRFDERKQYILGQHILYKGMLGKVVGFESRHGNLFVLLDNGKKAEVSPFLVTHASGEKPATTTAPGKTSSDNPFGHVELPPGMPKPTGNANDDAAALRGWLLNWREQAMHAGDTKTSDALKLANHLMNDWQGSSQGSLALGLKSAVANALGVHIGWVPIHEFGAGSEHLAMWLSSVGGQEKAQLAAAHIYAVTQAYMTDKTVMAYRGSQFNGEKFGIPVVGNSYSVKENVLSSWSASQHSADAFYSSFPGHNQVSVMMEAKVPKGAVFANLVTLAAFSGETHYIQKEKELVLMAGHTGTPKVIKSAVGSDLQSLMTGMPKAATTETGTTKYPYSGKYSPNPHNPNFIGWSKGEWHGPKVAGATPVAPTSGPGSKTHYIALPVSEGSVKAAHDAIVQGKAWTPEYDKPKIHNVEEGYVKGKFYNAGLYWKNPATGDIIGKVSAHHIGKAEEPDQSDTFEPDFTDFVADTTEPEIIPVDMGIENSDWLKHRASVPPPPGGERVTKYSEDQARDEHGRWTAGGWDSGTHSNSANRPFGLGTTHLLQAKFESGEKLTGGAINQTYLVKTKDGKQVVMKMEQGSRLGPFAQKAFADQLTRELAAIEVAKVVGLSDLMPMDGAIVHLDQPISGVRETGRAVVTSYIDKEHELGGYTVIKQDEAQRAYAFDYVIGNVDRHNGNYLVDQKTGKLALIDHGYSFPAIEINDAGKHHALFEYVGKPNDPIPQAIRDTYRENRSKILDAMQRSGIGAKPAQRVMARVDKLTGKNPVTWRQIRGDA